MARIKVCGITNEEDALKAAYYGAWAVGFIFFKDSPRYVSPSKVRRIVEKLPPFLTPVGVFVNSKEGAVRDICRFTRINTVQFHGDEDPSYCKRFKDFKIIKAIRINDPSSLLKIEQYKVDAYLFDAYQEKMFGGTGKTFNWDFLSGKKIDKPFILSGGLSVENISDAIKSVNTYAYDLSSSLEKEPGVKDARKIREFFEKVNSVI